MSLTQHSVLVAFKRADFQSSSLPFHRSSASTKFGLGKPRRGETSNYNFLIQIEAEITFTAF